MHAVYGFGRSCRKSALGWRAIDRSENSFEKVIDTKNFNKSVADIRHVFHYLREAADEIDKSIDRVGRSSLSFY